jgi:hypothetical protein
MFKSIMKKMIIVVALAALSAPARAYVVDGLLSDWGVTLFSQWTPSSPSADWVGIGENNWGGPNNTVPLNGFGGERFDVEAMYFDDTPSTLYFAIVTSVPQTGVESSGMLIRPGDVALSLGADGTYEYGIKTGPVGFGTLVANPVWSLAHGEWGWTANAPGEATGGEVLGTVSLAYVNTGVKDNGYTNYVIEGAIPIALLPNGYLPSGADLGVHWTMTCGNDAVDLKGDINNPVPEPASLLSLLVGLLGLGFLRFRKII